MKFEEIVKWGDENYKKTLRAEVKLNKKNFIIETDVYEKEGVEYFTTSFSLEQEGLVTLMRFDNSDCDMMELSHAFSVIDIYMKAND